jgi:ATP-dependent Lon protease
VLAAQRAGLKRVILPSENVHDLDDLPPRRGEPEFVLVDHVEEVLDEASRRRTVRRTGMLLERGAASAR